ncbi:MAG: VanZ family protein [Microbacterium sp.]
MGDQLTLGAIAVFIGLVVGAGLFVPFVAVSYRRRGRLTAGRMLLWLAALIYFWSIWTYTLLPLPDPESIRCVGVELDPLSVVAEVRKAFEGPGNPLTHPALLQLAFNVLLFLPLGFFVRVLGDRGVLVALGVGFGLSLLVETTQLTGVWGLYPCAYRFFDVGDLMTNTAGAVLGSVAGLIVPRARRGFAQSPDAGEPRQVTRGRRALAMLCDGLGLGFAAWSVGVVVQLWLAYVVHDEQALREGMLADLVGSGLAVAAWLVIVLATGRSFGDHVVLLRYSGSRLPAPVARLLRWLGGYGGISAIGMLPVLGDLLSSALVLLAVILLFTTDAGRGLPGILSGQYLRDAREPDAQPIPNRGE